MRSLAWNTDVTRNVSWVIEPPLGRWCSSQAGRNLLNPKSELASDSMVRIRVKSVFWCLEAWLCWLQSYLPDYFPYIAQGLKLLWSTMPTYNVTRCLKPQDPVPVVMKRQVHHFSWPYAAWNRPKCESLWVGWKTFVSSNCSWGSFPWLLGPRPIPDTCPQTGRLDLKDKTVKQKEDIKKNCQGQNLEKRTLSCKRRSSSRP